MNLNDLHAMGPKNKVMSWLNAISIRAKQTGTDIEHVHVILCRRLFDQLIDEIEGQLLREPESLDDEYEYVHVFCIAGILTCHTDDAVADHCMEVVQKVGSIRIAPVDLTLN